VARISKKYKKCAECQNEKSVEGNLKLETGNWKPEISVEGNLKPGI
jgi:hypothetical protein